MPRLSVDEQNQTFSMLLQVSTQQEVATAFGVHKTTVQRLQSRLRQFGNANDRPRSGHTRVTTTRQDRHIRLIHLRNRTPTPKKTAATTAGIHNQRNSNQTSGIRNKSVQTSRWKPINRPTPTCTHGLDEAS